jgi:hypothetical protein
MTFVSHDASRLAKVAQRRNMLVGVGINDLKAVPSRVRDENTASLGLKSSMIKRGTG